MLAARVLRFLLALGIGAMLWHLDVAPRGGWAQTPGQFAPADEAPEDFPDHPGREETFNSCVACHGFKLVAQQGQSRRQWDDTLDFMTEKHNMPKLGGKDRDIVLDYLAASFPPRPPARRGWQNPFQAPPAP